jgi:hypothetical protein
MQRCDNNDNVVPLSSWKSKMALKANEKSLSDYLNVLSFNDLLTETEDLINELNNKPLNQDITLKSKQLLREVNNRLRKDSDGFADTLKELRLKSEKKLVDIKELL